MKKPLKILLYLVPSILAVFLAAVNYRRISVSVGSIAPLFCLGIMLLMWFIYHSDDVSATGFYVISSFAEKNEEKQLQIMHRFANILLSLMPLQIVFILFFSELFVKVIGALAVVFLSFLIDAAINLIQSKKTPTTEDKE